MIGESLQLEMALAFLAAVTQAPDALDRGDAAAKRLLNDDVWGLIDHSLYLAKSPQERINFWASGAPLKAGGYTQESLAKIQKAYEDLNGKIGLLTGETQAKMIWAGLKKLAEVTGLKSTEQPGGEVIIPEVVVPGGPPLTQPGPSRGLVIAASIMGGVVVVVMVGGLVAMHNSPQGRDARRDRQVEREHNARVRRAL